MQTNFVKDIKIDCMNEIACSFGVKDKFMNDVNNLATIQELSIVRTLSAELKVQIAHLIGKMIIIDKDINYNEVKFYNTICKSCNIENDFNVDEYPDFNQSDPFVNPDFLINKN